MKNYIIIHHSFTSDSDTVSWEAIRRYHKSIGFSEIGYHFGIERVNGEYEVLMGRMPDKDGAHCKDAMMNGRGIGICCVGNFDNAPPSEELLSKLTELVCWLVRMAGIRPEFILGHREAQALGGIPPNKRKSCPGLMFDMDTFRARIDEALCKTL